MSGLKDREALYERPAKRVKTISSRFETGLPSKNPHSSGRQGFTLNENFTFAQRPSSDIHQPAGHYGATVRHETSLAPPLSPKSMVPSTTGGGSRCLPHKAAIEELETDHFTPSVSSRDLPLLEDQYPADEPGSPQDLRSLSGVTLQVDAEPQLSSEVGIAVTFSEPAGIRLSKKRQRSGLVNAWRESVPLEEEEPEPLNLTTSNRSNTSETRGRPLPPIAVKKPSPAYLPTQDLPYQSFDIPGNPYSGPDFKYIRPPNVFDSRTPPSGTSRSLLQNLGGAFSKLAMSMTGRPRDTRRTANEDATNEFDIYKDASRSTPTSYYFDSELEERREADGQPELVGPHTHIPRQPLRSMGIEPPGMPPLPENMTINPVVLLSGLSQVAYVQQTTCQDGPEQNFPKEENDSPSEGTHQNRPRDNGQTQPSTAEGEDRDGSEKRVHHPTRIVPGENTNVTERPPKPKPVTFTITRADQEAHFPRRRLYRRIKTFAGMKIDWATTISRAELDSLPCYPTSDRPWNRILSQVDENRRQRIPPGQKKGTIIRLRTGPTPGVPATEEPRPQNETSIEPLSQGVTAFQPSCQAANCLPPAENPYTQPRRNPNRKARGQLLSKVQE